MPKSIRVETKKYRIERDYSIVVTNVTFLLYREILILLMRFNAF